MNTKDTKTHSIEGLIIYKTQLSIIKSYYGSEFLYGDKATFVPRSHTGSVYSSANNQELKIPIGAISEMRKIRSKLNNLPRRAQAILRAYGETDHILPLIVRAKTRRAGQDLGLVVALLLFEAGSDYPKTDLLDLCLYYEKARNQALEDLLDKAEKELTDAIMLFAGVKCS